MKTLQYKIRTKSPIIISDSSGDLNMVSSKSYIPASNLIGALAVRYIKDNKLNYESAHFDEKFNKWFLSGKIKYLNAYPVKAGTNELTFPIPSSIHYEKLKKEILHDLFFGDEVKVQTKQFNDAGSIKENKLETITVVKTLNPHHEVDSSSGAVKQGIFFNYESIKEDTCFNGLIIVPDEDLSGFEAFLHSCKIINIGRSKNTQYGKVELNVSSHSHSAEKIENNSCTLLLTSDTIILNNNGFSSGNFNDLEAELKLKLGSDIKIENQFLKTTQVENFVAIWNLKRESETAFAAGSSLKILNCSLNEKELSKLELSGIGERTSEGFGKVKFIPNSNGIKKAEHKNDTSNQQKPEMPDAVKDIARKIVLENLKKDFITQAYQNAGKFGVLSNSQIGRLEKFIKSANNKESFRTNIEALRDTAKEKMTKCHIEGSNLLDFLTQEEKGYKKQMNFAKIKFDEQQKFRDIIEPLFIENDTELEFIFIKLYLTTLFVALRKKNGGK